MGQNYELKLLVRANPTRMENINSNFYFHFFLVPQKVLWRP